ncbi:hypothetical protein BZL30_1514 [Mycobacterium kansasii]|uniref:Phosphoribosyl transferase domain protein n=1 Tax=Mycobacterium kansasii TaxID=1768 RepID=A0A1V3XTN7_MYCKA|nr:hypothetical protein BZL30_1514 [Mycobacterium kansasii]
MRRLRCAGDPVVHRLLRGALGGGRSTPRREPRVDPRVPVFALGRYAGARRQAILAMKEHGRRDLVVPLARALAVGIHRLLSWGVVDAPLTLVPAPTRRSAARRRGGDPVTRIATAAVAAHPGITVVEALRLKGLVRDSVGLGTSARERNLAGRVLLRGRRLCAEVVIVDDVVTTGRLRGSRSGPCGPPEYGWPLCWRSRRHDKLSPVSCPRETSGIRTRQKAGRFAGTVG